MREKLNSNPLAQAVLVGVLLLFAGVFAISSMGGGEEKTEEAATASSSEAATASSSAVTTEGSAVTTGAASQGAPAALPAPGSGAGAPPPPPRAVIAAFDANKTVVLLFVRDGGIDDRMVAADVRRLGSLSNVAAFVVPASRVAHYAGIAQGVELDRVPALVVLRPKRLGATPAASVQYGYQSPESVEQAIIDAGYRGRTVPYHPVIMEISRDFPGHLRPVPAPGDSTAPVLETNGTVGLTPPVARGRSSGFVTDVLVDLGYVPEDRARSAIEEARTAGRPPEELLLQQGFVTADQLSRAVAERYGLDHIDLSVYQVDMAAANLISVNTARRYRAMPVGFVDRETLLVAMADPSNVLAVDDIQIATSLDCRVAVAAGEDIDALIGRLNTLQSAVSEAVVEGEEEAGEELAEVSDFQVSAEDAPVIKLVYSILGQAVGEGASDVHFEPGENEMRVRFRIDGVLREAAHVPKRMVNAVVSRVKIMSDLNIAEKRVPQDGRVSITVEDRRVDLRITTLPTQRGEGATIRILDKDNAQRSLDDLGMDGGGRERFEAAVRQAYGAVLVTGPTGSGKSTTLYAALQDLNDVEKNIITVEDPVEYRLNGISQINVNRKAGLDFATGLRSILRADPDIVMVGEIRDGETARIAIEAALTGHLMLTTLHTNDAPGAITRLSKMGIEAFLIASAVDCVVAQRLARKLCKHCKGRAIVPEQALLDAGLPAGSELEAYEPAGCGRCNQSGYRGRVGIYSVMTMSERIREMAIGQISEAEISKVAREEGMLTLREAGLAKVREGVTSLEEILRVTA